MVSGSHLYIEFEFVIWIHALFCLRAVNYLQARGRCGTAVPPLTLVTRRTRAEEGMTWQQHFLGGNAGASTTRTSGGAIGQDSQDTRSCYESQGGLPSLPTEATRMREMLGLAVAASQTASVD